MSEDDQKYETTNCIRSKAPSTRDPRVNNGTKANEKTNYIGTCLHLEYTTSVTSQRIEATGEVLCSRPRATHGCSVKKGEKII